jgi:CRP-like cAMP-binding protein
MKDLSGTDGGFLANRKADLLREVPLFDGLETDELSIVSVLIHVFPIDKDEVLFREGEEGQYICFVLGGCLDVIKNSENDHSIEIATLTKGRTLGEMSIVDDIPRSATIKAREYSKLASLSFADFETIINDHPTIGVKILKGLLRYLSLNMRKTTKQLADSKDAMTHLFKLATSI